MKKISLLFSTIAALLLVSGGFVSCGEESVDGVGVSQFSSFSVSPESITLSCGDSQQISVTTVPEYTFAEGELLFSVLNDSPEECVTVSSTGLVTAVDELIGSNGSATILVNTLDGANPRYVDVVVTETKNLRIDSDDLIVSKLSELSQLYAIVGGFSGESFSVDWASSDDEIIEIEPYPSNTQYGEITILDYGVVRITATLLDSTDTATEYSDQITITVLDVEVEIADYSTTLSTGTKYTFESIVTVDGEVDDSFSVEWYLSDANGNAVTSSDTGSEITTAGVFTPGDTQGTVYVSVDVIGMSGITPSATTDALTIYVPVSVKINESEPIVYTITGENSYQFTTTLSPTNANIYSTAVVVWSLSDDSFATIDQTGLVTLKDGYDSGEVTVIATVYAEDGSVESTNSTTLTFDPNEVVAVESVTIGGDYDDADNKTLSLAFGESYTLSATILPEDAVNQSVRWTISPEDQTVISMSGTKITAIGTGTVVVTVTSEDRSNDYPSDSITINVSGVSIPTLGDGGDL